MFKGIEFTKKKLFKGIDNETQSWSRTIPIGVNHVSQDFIVKS